MASFARAAQRSLPAAVLGLLALSLVAPATAQEPDPAARERIHYAFATYLGSGIYSVEGQTVQVYTFPVTFTLHTEEQRGWALQLCLPTTIGLYDLKAEDALVTPMVERFATIGVVPRVQAPLRVTWRWTVTPFVDLGAARDLDRAKTTWVYGGGARGDAAYPVGRYQLRPGILAMYAHAQAEDLHLGNDLSKLESGLDFRVPLGFSIRGERADLGFFGKNYTYLRELELLRPEGGTFDLTTQWELGVTFGTREPFKILRVPIPRFGLSFRFGSDISAIRIVFGSPV